MKVNISRISWETNFRRCGLSYLHPRFQMHSCIIIHWWFSSVAVSSSEVSNAWENPGMSILGRKLIHLLDWEHLWEIRPVASACTCSSGLFQFSSAVTTLRHALMPLRAFIKFPALSGMFCFCFSQAKFHKTFVPPFKEKKRKEARCTLAPLLHYRNRGVESIHSKEILRVRKFTRW